MSIPYSAVPAGAMLMLAFVWLDLIINWRGGRGSGQVTGGTPARA